jgi:hypothetical protein
MAFSPLAPQKNKLYRKSAWLEGVGAALQPSYIY